MRISMSMPCWRMMFLAVTIGFLAMPIADHVIDAEPLVYVPVLLLIGMLNMAAGWYVTSWMLNKGSQAIGRHVAAWLLLPALLVMCSLVSGLHAASEFFMLYIAMGFLRTTYPVGSGIAPVTPSERGWLLLLALLLVLVAYFALAFFGDRLAGLFTRALP